MSRKVLADPARWRDLLQTYAKSSAIFLCPSDPGAGTRQDDESVEHRNSVFTSYDTTPLPEGGDFGPNDSLRLSIDANRRTSYAQDRILMKVNPAKGLIESMSFHNERMNVLFLDGRVDNIPVNG